MSTFASGFVLVSKNQTGSTGETCQAAIRYAVMNVQMDEHKYNAQHHKCVHRNNKNILIYKT